MKQNIICEVIDLIEYYNFDIGFVSINFVNHLKSDLRTYIEYLDL
jgi:hypothetical protein